MVVDKSLDTILPLLPHHARYYFVQPQIPRALSAKALANAAEKQLLEGVRIPQCAERDMKQPWPQPDPKDLVFVGGSTFVVAEVL